MEVVGVAGGGPTGVVGSKIVESGATEERRRSVLRKSSVWWDFRGCVWECGNRGREEEAWPEI